MHVFFSMRRDTSNVGICNLTDLKNAQSNEYSKPKSITKTRSKKQ